MQGDRILLLAMCLTMTTCAPPAGTRRTTAPEAAAVEETPAIETPAMRRTRALAHLRRLTEKPRLSATDVQVTFAADRLTTEEGVATLLSGLDDPELDVRDDARHLLWQLPAEFHPELVRLCPGRHRGLVAQILATQGPRSTVWVNELLSWHAGAEDALTRLAIFNALGVIAPEHPEAQAAFTRGLTDPDAQIRLFAVTYLIDSPEARPLVETTLKVLRLSKDRTVADTARFWQDFLKNSRFARLEK